jgi:hypothetical protein
MKKLILVLIFVAFIITPMIGSYTRGHFVLISPKTNAKAEIIDNKSFVLKTLTIYHPTKRQCDDTPLITASNAKIDTVKLFKQQIRWIALSRDLLKRWKGVFNYGDTILLNSGDKKIDGLWIIQDNLNKRYKNRGDLLFDSRIRKHGKWKDVKITKL